MLARTRGDFSEYQVGAGRAGGRIEGGGWGWLGFWGGRPGLLGWGEAGPGWGVYELAVGVGVSGAWLTALTKKEAIWARVTGWLGQ